MISTRRKSKPRQKPASCPDFCSPCLRFCREGHVSTNRINPRWRVHAIARTICPMRGKAMEYETIKVVKDNWLGILTLNRPAKMNALSKELQLEMQHALDDLEADENIRAVIINGEGKCFSAGFDISGTGTGEPPSVQQWRANVKRENDTWYRIWRSRLPFIAAVHGYCL